MSLNSLPTELQCSIARLLDPIGLISLSQTNRHLRLLINPQETHFVERLLQLETIEEHGGFTPIFKIWASIMDPDFGVAEETHCFREDWHSIRWACCSCLRLLPHRCFRNNSIMEAAYQKPVPGSPACTALTTWELSAHQVRESKPEMPSGLIGLVELYEQLGEEKFYESRIEPDFRGNEHNGSNRQNRRCLECQYRRGELPWTLAGFDGIPAMPNRVALFWTELDRFFPGISDHLGFQIPPVFPCGRRENMPLGWNMWMVRCPRCTRWKELRDFRLGSPYMINDPLFSEGCYCNACFASAHGRLELGCALGRWFTSLLDYRLQNVSSIIKQKVPWLDLRAVPPETAGSKSKLREIQQAVPCLRPEHDSILSDQDISDLKLYRAQAIAILEGTDGRMAKAFPRKLVAWEEFLENCEAALKSLNVCKTRSEENPEAFAAWALDRDESSWDTEVEGALSRKMGPDFEFLLGVSSISF